MSKGWNDRGGDPRSRSRGARVRVKTARGRKLSSTRWLERQLNDPYVVEARRLGYRSRAAFKFRELDEKYQLTKGAKRAVDLGCAPGGWTQLLVQKLGPNAEIIGIDIQEVEPISGAKVLLMDFLAHDAEDRLIAELGGKADLVLSDMANAATGHRQTDHMRTMSLAEAALDFAIKVLDEGGSFAAKVLRGGSDNQLMARMQKHFKTVKHAKPPSSRPDSKEWFVVAKGFRAVPPSK